jgi:glycosyltransferase involved in cell wall biosynthesis
MLTIAIPTYNRIEYLKELLPSLIEQCKPYPEIEVLVIDNNSTDGTWDYLNKLDANIIIGKNIINVGADENFVRCLEAARGRYVWLFGDDEQLCPGAIEKVVNILNTYPVSLLVMQTRYKTKSMWFKSYKDFIKSVNARVVLDHTLITCNIFRKHIFDTNIARKYQWTNYGHMYAIMEHLKENGSVYHLTDTIFKETRVNPNFPKYISLKHILYLLYLSKLYPYLFKYLCRFTIGALINRGKKHLISHKRNRLV